MAFLGRSSAKGLFSASQGAGPLALWRRASCSEGFARLNLYKDAEKAPKELSDEEYPIWLWRLLHPEPTKKELEREAQGLFDKGGYDAVLDGMPERKLKRLFRLHARSRIQGDNQERLGGDVF